MFFSSELLWFCSELFSTYVLILERKMRNQTVTEPSPVSEFSSSWWEWQATHDIMLEKHQFNYHNVQIVQCFIDWHHGVPVNGGKKGESNLNKMAGQQFS